MAEPKEAWAPPTVCTWSWMQWLRGVSSLGKKMRVFSYMWDSCVPSWRCSVCGILREDYTNQVSFLSLKSCLDSTDTKRSCSASSSCKLCINRMHPPIGLRKATITITSHTSACPSDCSPLVSAETFKFPQNCFYFSHLCFILWPWFILPQDNQHQQWLLICQMK